MAELDPAKVIRRVRHRIKVSQEGLSRLLNTTKGAVQHWERGRNHPDVIRLVAMRQFCPPGPERKELDALIRQTESRVTPQAPPAFKDTKALRDADAEALSSPAFLGSGLDVLRRQNLRLNQQLERLKATINKKDERIRVLEDLAKGLEKQVSALRGGTPAPEGERSA